MTTLDTACYNTPPTTIAAAVGACGEGSSLIFVFSLGHGHSVLFLSLRNHHSEAIAMRYYSNCARTLFAINGAICSIIKNAFGAFVCDGSEGSGRSATNRIELWLDFELLSKWGFSPELLEFCVYSS